jgi:hypothetical protein
VHVLDGEDGRIPQEHNSTTRARGKEVEGPVEVGTRDLAANRVGNAVELGLLETSESTTMLDESTAHHGDDPYDEQSTLHETTLTF